MLDFVNHTPFPALKYDVRHPNGEEHHVLVARGTFDLRRLPPTSDPAATLTHEAALAREQAPLVFSDVYSGELNRSSVKLESDLAQHKPRCDVIVIAEAHSPTGEPVPRIDVRAHVWRASPTAPDERTSLLDCRIAVHGKRWFENDGQAWKLSDPEPFVRLPLCYERAFGGELTVYAQDDAAMKVGAEHRLSEEARAKHPEGDAAPIAHATATCNPLGIGFLEAWYVHAANIDRWPAPQIESPDTPLLPDVFDRMLRGKARVGEVPALKPRGMGVIAKSWQPRLSLAGTFDAEWLADRWPRMPVDFDMAYWNGAHPDMQCEHLIGAETIELWNLLPPEGRGDKPCALTAPVVHMAAHLLSPAGASAFRVVPVDTLVIDLIEMRLHMTWRISIPVAEKHREASLLALAYEARPSLE